MSVQIKNIYAGKPDAKDEIEAEGLDSFLENYVMPSNFNIDALINDSYYFITGYKGTGKTALLYYIDYLIRKSDEQARSSFIFFKEDYSDLKKQEFEHLSKRLISSITIGNDVVLDGQDFEYIWRWLFYQRIIEDNEECNYGLFLKNEKWEKFEEYIKSITSERKKKFLSIPAKAIISCAFNDNINQTSVQPKAELDFLSSKLYESEDYRLFVKIIESADSLFTELTRTDIPYYIFVDELEAYYGEDKVFRRDLRLIRDLIFTVKKLNSVFSANKAVKTKIICSVRTEILNAITRFVITKELNKVSSGYEVPLIWDYTNTNSFSHPILKILIKRIEYAEKNHGEFTNEKNLVAKWFPEKINNIDPANYLLNNSWCKPRDIVRLILAAQNCLGSSNTSFSQATIDLCHKKYSTDSLIEIKEEMKALYSADEINTIFLCLTGFKAVFTVMELKNRIERYHKDSIWCSKLNLILDDLYRLGIIGNYSPASKSYRWQHKGDDGLILSDEWKIMIHSALQSALSVSKKQDRALRDNSKANLQVGTMKDVKIINILPYFAIVSFEEQGEEYIGSIHISQISNSYVSSIHDFVSENNTYSAKVLGYDEAHNKWSFSLK